MADYGIVSSPPVLDPPTLLSALGGPAVVAIDLTPNPGPSLYQTEVQLTYFEGDWTHPVVFFLAPDTAGALLAANPGSTVWLRARSNDKYMTTVSWVEWPDPIVVYTVDSSLGFSALTDAVDATAGTGTVT